MPMNLVFIVETIVQWVGIPVRIGIAPTKTLAKIASHVAKKRLVAQGVCCLMNNKYIACLKTFTINEIWGLVDNLSRRLNDLSIYSAMN